MLRFRSGALGTMSSSCLLEARHRVGLRLITPGRVLDLRERALSDHELRVDDVVVTRSDQDPIAAEDRAFVEMLLGRGDDVRVPYDEALRTHALVCAIDRSARTGEPMDLTEASSPPAAAVEGTP
jgi:predicted dehydrogenase